MGARVFGMGIALFLGTMMRKIELEDGLDCGGPVRARDLYRDALSCVAREQLHRAQNKLRLALLYDPAYLDARRELDRLTV